MKTLAAQSTAVTAIPFSPAIPSKRAELKV